MVIDVLLRILLFILTGKESSTSGYVPYAIGGVVMKQERGIEIDPKWSVRIHCCHCCNCNVIAHTELFRVLNAGDCLEYHLDDIRGLRHHAGRYCNMHLLLKEADATDITT